MPFVSITKPSVGNPTRKTLADQIIDNLVDLNTRVSATSSLQNSSFEFDTDSDNLPDGWTVTNYVGGSSPITTSQRAHGAKSFSFTSTVLANGGGDAQHTDFVACAGSKWYAFEAWLLASVANIAAKAEVNWYDAAQSFISAGTIANLTNTPTSWTQYGVSLQSPSGARYYKIKLTGGVPGAGSATGTIYFDGVWALDVPALGISNAMIAASAVTWGKISAGLQQQSGLTTSAVSISFTGGTRTMGWGLSSSGPADPLYVLTYLSAGYASGTRVTAGDSSTNYYFNAAYINSSPPWDLGDGEIQLFAFAEIRPDGTVVRIDIADAPPWAYNGPTSLKPDIERGGRKYQVRPAVLAEHANLKAAVEAGMTRAQFLARLRNDPRVEVEITQAVKNADMPLIPHPFGAVAPGNAVVLIDPLSPLMQNLIDLRQADPSQAVTDLFMERHLVVQNTAVPNRAAPPGVPLHAARWKLT